MRLRLDATPEELQSKGEELLKALADQVRDGNPELAHTLEKAARKEPVLKYKAMRQLHDANRAAYKVTLESMTSDIEDVLSGTASKSLPILDQLSKAKSDKQSVVYLHEASTEYQCLDCPMWIKDTDRCTIHGKGDVIRAHGSCSFWVQGPPTSSSKDEPHGLVTKQQSGYAESKTGFSCKRCSHFDTSENTCSKVEGAIHPDACCNAWEPADVIKGMTPEWSGPLVNTVERYAPVDPTVEVAAAQELFDRVYGSTLEKADDEGRDPGDPEPDPDYDEESGEPIVDPKTGLSPSEAAQEPPEEDEGEAEKSSGAELVADPAPHSIKREPALEKAETKPLDTPLEYDHTKVIADKDDVLYQRVRKMVARKSPEMVTQGDFDEEGGRFYGWSTNELLEWVRSGAGTQP